MKPKAYEAQNMNKTISEDHVCTFCQSTEQPEDIGAVFLQCRTCGYPQIPGVSYEPSAPKIKYFDCDTCRKMIQPIFQVRVLSDITGYLMGAFVWECPKCKIINFTPDDLGVLDDEIILEGEI